MADTLDWIDREIATPARPFGLPEHVGLSAALSALRVATKVDKASTIAGELDDSSRLLYRYRNGPETATRLGRKAAEAEKAGFPHGVSVTTSPDEGRPCAVANCSDVQNVFDVTKTGTDPHHYTVELPKPVTQDVADDFNDLFTDLP
jgi:hypothetical protein